MADPRSQFGPQAEKYLTSAVHSNEAALRRIVEVAEPNGGTLLDVATGAGHVAHVFASHMDRVIASDITPQMLEVTGRVAKERGLSNVSLCLAWAEELPFKSNSLTAVTCRIAAHHFKDVPKFLSECRRVLKPEGWLLISDTIGIEDLEADEQLDRIEFLRDPSHVRNYRKPEWQDMFKAAGFEVELFETSPKPINMKDWLDRMSVPDATREHLYELVTTSSGWLRDYLRPHGEGDFYTFHLHEALFKARPRG